MKACRENHIEVVRLLLDYGCAVNAPFPNSSRENPLTLASEKGHVELVRLLLERGGNVEVCTPPPLSFSLLFNFHAIYFLVWLTATIIFVVF